MRRFLIAATLLALMPAAASATETITYGYDAIGRLVVVSHSGDVNAGQQTSYSYDLADNRTSVTRNGH